MSKKKDKMRRVVLPEDHVERFWKVVESLVEPFGINRVSEVYQYVKMLGDAVDRHVGEKRYGVSSEERGYKKFLAVFRARYIELADLEYPFEVTGIDVKCVKQFMVLLTEKGFDIEEYLKWVFEVFLEDNPKFSPPTVRQVCAHFVTNRFFFENKEVMKERQQRQILEKEIYALVERAKKMISEARAAGRLADKEKVLNLLKLYRSEDIMFNEFRRGIEKLEKEIGGARHGDGHGEEDK